MQDTADRIGARSIEEGTDEEKLVSDDDQIELDPRDYDVERAFTGSPDESEKRIVDSNIELFRQKDGVLSHSTKHSKKSKASNPIEKA